jgi:hypothetical protein
VTAERSVVRITYVPLVPNQTYDPLAAPRRHFRRHGSVKNLERSAGMFELFFYFASCRPAIYSFCHGAHINCSCWSNIPLQDEGLGSFTDVDDLAGTFNKVCFL